MATSLSAILPLYREHYHDNITEIFFNDDKEMTPFLANLESKAMDDGFGRGYVVPIEYGTGSAISHTFSVAQTKSQGSTAGSSAPRDRWVVQAVGLEATCQWTRDAILAAQSGGESKLVDAIDREIKARTAGMRKRLATYIWGNGWGTIGTISATSSTTITLSTSVVNRIDVGDELVASSAEAGTAAWRNTASAIVTGINPDTGVVTLGTNPATLSWAVGDYVFLNGDHENSTNSNALSLWGMGAWVPTSAPSGAFCGVTRTGIPALCGIRYSTSGEDHASMVIGAVNKLFKHGQSKADIVYFSPEDYATLCKDKESTKSVSITLGKYSIGFDAVTVDTVAGRVPVVPDPMLPQGTAYAGPFSDKRYAPFLAHNNKLVNIDDIAGNNLIPLASSTAYEARLFFRGNLICPAPGKFIAISGLPSS